MVVKCNKNSNGTKKAKEKNTMAVQCPYKRTYIYTVAWSLEELK